MNLPDLKGIKGEKKRQPSARVFSHIKKIKLYPFFFSSEKLSSSISENPRQCGI